MLKKSDSMVKRKKEKQTTDLVLYSCTDEERRLRERRGFPKATQLCVMLGRPRIVNYLSTFPKVGSRWWAVIWNET